MAKVGKGPGCPLLYYFKKPFMMKRFGALAVIGVLAALSCGKNGNFPSTPYLGFTSISPDHLVNGDTANVITIVCEFRDAEGDLSGPVFFQQSNNPVGFDSLYVLPNLPDQKNMKGNLILQLHNNDIFYPPSTGTDTVTFSMYIKDDAGHISDTIQTSKIALTTN